MKKAGIFIVIYLVLNYIIFKFIKVPAGCGGEILPNSDGSLNGIIESPNFGHSYFSNLNCLWVINSTSLWSNKKLNELEQSLKNDQQIAIEFLEMDIPATAVQFNYGISRALYNCRGDFVEVWLFFKHVDDNVIIGDLQIYY